MITQSIAILLSAATLLAPESDQTPAPPPIEIPAHWVWEIEPDEVQGRADKTREFVAIGETGSLIIHWTDDKFRARFVEGLASRTPEDIEQERHRTYMLVLENDAGDVSMHSHSTTMGNDRQFMHQWQRTRVDGDAIARIGLIRLDEQGRRLISADAVAEAESHGIGVLPLAVKGQPFPFDLPTMDGSRITNIDLEGQVVLIDNWATWCMPCMAKMPELRALHEQYEADGLRVIGIDWDKDIETARQAMERESMHWPGVHVYQSEERAEELWLRSMSINALPYLVLLDRNGIVVEFGQPERVLPAARSLMTDRTAAAVED